MLKLYSDLCLLKGVQMVEDYLSQDCHTKDNQLSLERTVVAEIDKGIIRAGTLITDSKRRIMNMLFEALSTPLASEAPNGDKDLIIDECRITEKVQRMLTNLRNPLVVLSSSTLFHFQSFIDQKKTFTMENEPVLRDGRQLSPVLLPGIAKDWPALTNWKSKWYLLSQTNNGERLVPVEIGKSYAKDEWSQSLWRFEDLLQAITASELSSENEFGVVYLAQHNLLSQIPALYADVLVPDLVYVDIPDKNPNEQLIINCWFGPWGPSRRSILIRTTIF